MSSRELYLENIWTFQRILFKYFAIVIRKIMPFFHTYRMFLFLDTKVQTNVIDYIKSIGILFPYLEHVIVVITLQMR